MKLILIACGGALGAIARYGLSTWLHTRWTTGFPVGTLAVNVLGCLLLGSLMAYAQVNPLLRPEFKLFLAVGVLGAFTTFSTFGYETSLLLQQGSMRAASLSVLLNVVVGLGALEVGRLLTGWYLR